MDLMSIRRSIMQGRRLPPGYQQVEYISGTGSQYIDSRVECTSNLCVDFAFSVSTSSQYAMCGGIDNQTPVFRHHGMLYSFNANYTYLYSLAIGNDAFSSSIAVPQLNVVYNVYIDPAAGVYRFTGENYNESGTFTPLTARTTGRGYGILARLAKNGAVQSRPSRIYYFKFWRGGKLIGDFIPCYRKSDNEPGMYDLVTNVFFTNQGSGTIGVGQDV